MLNIESPPNSKKLSSTPTRSTPNTSDQIPASVPSSSVRGATYFPPSTTPRSGAGSARRSTFPFGVNGNRSIVTNHDGTMYSGNRSLKYSRNTPTSYPSRTTTYAARRFSPTRSSRAKTTASRTPCVPTARSRSLQARSDTHGPPPGRPRVPKTQASHPRGGAPGPPSGTNEIPPRVQTDPARIAPPSDQAGQGTHAPSPPLPRTTP